MYKSTITAVLLLLSIVFLSTTTVSADDVFPTNRGECDWARIWNFFAFAVWDELIPISYLDLYLPLEPARNTLAYRQEAADFYRRVWGITNINVSDPNPHFISINGIPNAGLFQGFTLNPLVRYQLYGIDHQGVGKLRGKLPLTNTYNLDDGFLIFILTDVTVVANMSDAPFMLMPFPIKAGEFLVMGRYRWQYTDKDGVNTTFLNLRYEAECPTAYNSQGFLTINCKIYNVDDPTWGQGQVHAQGWVVPEGGMLRATTRVTYDFPNRFDDKPAADTTPWGDNPRCENLPA